MSHKDAPPETPSQVACREFWQREQPHINRAWGQAKDGSYFAENSRLLHKSWVTAAAERDAEIEELRAEVATWEGLHASEVQLRQRWHARAERLAEALRPFANLDLRPDGFDKRPDDQTIYARDRTAITVGDVRCARAALRDHDQEARNG